MDRVAHCAFIGFGEVGELFSRQIFARGGVAIAAYDLKLDNPETARPMLAAAQNIGVTLAKSAAQAAQGAEIVFSAVTADAAEAVALEASSWLVPGQIFVDLNSASPSTKNRAAQNFAAKNLDYVEGAVMAPVAGPGIGVEILAGGAKAAACAEKLNALGMNLRAVSDKIGRASATKLCRSIMIKGIEALMLDSARASAHWGVAEDVFASLNASFQNADWAELAEKIDARVARHGLRRAAEMREAAAMIADLGLDPALALAVADRQQRRVADGK